MKEVKVSELQGAALDWAVCAAQVYPLEMQSPDIWSKYGAPYNPSSNWKYCGQLIEQYKPWISPPVKDPCEPIGWDAEIYDPAGNEIIGRAMACDSALVAVCRAVVHAKLGDLVSIPDELME